MIGLLLPLIGFVQTQPNSAETHFETKVRPLLANHCWKCHGADSARGNLRLDSAAGISKGGNRGPVVNTSQPETSLLVQAIRRKGELKMPPDGSLSDLQVSDLVRWIKDGAIFPANSAIKLPEQGHWAFQPIKPLGPISGNPIDHLVKNKLAKEGISPAPPADSLSLLRRITLDLTGLPPTIAEVDSFLNDKSANAWNKVVDRLLASPAYGERWGRHWLDVARYADSNGLDENVAHGNAWRYRDYVVNAFNSDMPFDQFIREQVAGDLLEAGTAADKHRMLIATGFLAMGPKVLAEVDKKKLEMDIIDEQIDTMGKAFLGMTLGCARCHDHKFDPITSADYYGLAGIFKSTKTMDDLKTVAKWHENQIANTSELTRLADHQAKVTKAKLEVDGFIESRKKLLVKEGKLVSDPKLSGKDVEAKLTQQDAAELKKLKSSVSELEKQAPDLPSAMGVAESTPVSLAIHLRGSTERLGPVVSRGVPKVLSTGINPAFPEKSSGRKELALWLSSDRNPLTARVIVNRVWRWHFGTGIVPSVDNFGLLGDKPTNPELLDWLASEFIRTGWSLKKLHRLILQSETYRQSTSQSQEAALKDPSGKLFSRWIPRRMEAETIRDSMLDVSGKLDKTMGGSLLTVKNREYFFNHTSTDLTRYDSNRRTIYLPVVRNNLYEVVQLFDGTDASVSNGDRSGTTVATQALFFLNSPLAMECSQSLAESVTRNTSVPEKHQLEMMYRIALGRRPTATESQRALSFMRNAGAVEGIDPRKAFAALAQVLLCSNEFVTIR